MNDKDKDLKESLKKVYQYVKGGFLLHSEKFLKRYTGAKDVMKGKNLLSLGADAGMICAFCEVGRLFARKFDEF